MKNLNKPLIAILSVVVLVGVYWMLSTTDNSITNNNQEEPSATAQNAIQPNTSQSLNATLDTSDNVINNTQTLNSDVATQAATSHPKAISKEQIEQWKRRDHDGLYEEVQPDGSVKVDLQGRFQHVITATKDENGNLIIEE